MQKPNEPNMRPSACLHCSHNASSHLFSWVASSTHRQKNCMNAIITQKFNGHEIWSICVCMQIIFSQLHFHLTFFSSSFKVHALGSLTNHMLCNSACLAVNSIWLTPCILNQLKFCFFTIVGYLACSTTTASYACVVRTLLELCWRPERWRILGSRNLQG